MKDSIFKKFGYWGFMLLILSGVFCVKKNATNTDQDDQICKVLFIGNSMTYCNGLPTIFRLLADSAGKEVLIDSSTVGGWQMVHHSGSQMTHDKIFEQDWDYVVLQEAVFEIAFSEYHNGMRSYVEMLEDWILENHSASKIIYCLSWALKNGIDWYGTYYTYSEAQEMMRDGTIEFVEDTDWMIAPVGWTWHTVIGGRPDIELYQLDGQHPSYAGSYLSACVYFVTIFQETIVGNGFTGQCDTGIATYFQNTASDLVLNALALWNISPL